MPAAELRFRVMASDTQVLVVDGPPDLADFARYRLGQLQRAWSRFEQDSDVSALNARSGEAIVVGGDTILLVQAALLGWESTGGRFDPTVLPALVAAGYTHSIEVPDEPAFPASLPAGAQARGCEGIEIDVAASTVRLPAGVAFDPGGIGKGLAADLLTGELLEAGAAGALVNIGGDLRVRGEAPGGIWSIGLEDPIHPAGDVARIGLGDGGVATSSPLVRRWTRDGRSAHHLIDPATGLPGETGVASATVVAGHAWRAEALSKAAYLAGLPDGCDVVAGAGAAGLLIDMDGRVHPAGDIGRFLL